MLKKVLYPGREEPNTMYVKLFGERKLVYHHTNYYFKMQMIPKKDISEILLFINSLKKFCGIVTILFLMGYVDYLKATCLLTTLYSEHVKK